MGESAEESNRVSVQISSLSTQLIESIDKQSQLEEKLNQARRTIQSQKSSIDNYNELKSKYDAFELALQAKDRETEKLKTEMDKEKALRRTAEQTADNLNKEIEDLTASLFDEANKMVATARKESHTMEVKNSKLKELLEEKDLILETLNLQLKNLKKVLQNLEKENISQSGSRPSIVGNDNSNSSISIQKTSTSNSAEQTLGPIYSPNVTSVRYDLNLYTEFLKFIAVLPYCEALKDTSSDSKLLRRLVNDEIQPALRLDNASGLGWIVRRTLMSLMMEGLVVVEPLSGLNENFQYGYASPSLSGSAFSPIMAGKDAHLFSYPSDSPPIAVHDKCSFCSEARDDVIEHARMYVLKTQTRTEDGSVIVTNSFPLCRYCLLKVRQTCEIFAFLRSLKLGAWHLETVSLTSIAKGESNKFTEVSNANRKDPKKDEKRLQRMSFIPGMGQSSKLAPQVDIPVDQVGAPTTNIQRAWLQLCKLRATLHWAHIGIWSVEDAVTQKIGPVISESGEEDAETVSTVADEARPLKKAASDDNSFTLKKGDEEEGATGEDPFDFENANTSLPIVEDNSTAKSLPTEINGESSGLTQENQESSTKDDTRPSDPHPQDAKPSEELEKDHNNEKIGSLDPGKADAISAPQEIAEIVDQSSSNSATAVKESTNHPQESVTISTEAVNETNNESDNNSNNEEDFDDAVDTQAN